MSPMAEQRDYYEVLGVARDASADEVKRAYRKVAAANHPDRNPGDQAAVERFKEAAEALEHLVVTARAKHILMSYNDEGVLSFDEVRRILGLRGRPQTFSKTYNRFKADSNREYKRDATVEYLHYVRVVH